MLTKITVKFSSDLPQQVEGPALLHFEQELRRLSGQDVRVFKERMGDDSKLRVMMTKVERDAL